MTLNSLPPQVLEKVYEEAWRRAKQRIHSDNSHYQRLWQPDPRNKPQCLAFELADKVMEMGFGGEPGGGKLLALDTPIPSVDGWTTMGKVAVGDRIFDADGRLCRVTNVSPIQLDITYRLTFSDGSVIVAGASHLWLTETRRDRQAQLKNTPEYRAKRRATRPRRGTGKRPDLVVSNQIWQHEVLMPSLGAVRTTQNIVDTLYGRSDRLNHSIRNAKPLALPDQDLIIPPYILGAWLGDGTTAGASVTGIDSEIFDQFREAGYAVNDYPGTNTKGILGLKVQLRAIGVLNNKHIPANYLRASIEQRLELLQGLMDTDGYCDPRGQCEFTTTNVAIRDGVYELLCSLGIKVAIVTGRAMLRGKDCGEKYRLKFLTDLAAFKLKRKLERQKRGDFRGTHERRYIVSAEQIDPVPMRCIAVDSSSHLYLAGKSMIPTHNTDLALGLAATKFSPSLIIRREFPQLQQIIDRGDEFLPTQYVGGVKRRWEYNGHIVALGSMQHDKDWRKYQGRARQLLAVDEAAEFPEKPIRSITGWNRASTPDQKTLVLYCFNPPTTPEGEWIIRYFAPWLDPQYPNPAESGEIRWMAHLPADGAAEKIIERPDGEPFDHNGSLVYPISRTFIRSTRRDNPYLNLEEYERRLDSLPEPLRSILKTGDFTVGQQDDPWQVIPTNWILEAQERWRKTARPDVALRSIGVDVAHGGADNTVIAQIFGTWFAELLVYPGKATPDGDEVAKRVDDIWDKQAAIGVDAVGYGASATDVMRGWGMKPLPINFGAASQKLDASRRFQFFNQRAECYWAFRDALDPKSGEDICLPPSRTLRADLTAVRYKIVRGKIQLEAKEDVKKRLGRSPDEGDTVVLAWRAAQGNGLWVRLE